VKFYLSIQFIIMATGKPLPLLDFKAEYRHFDTV